MVKQLLRGVFLMLAWPFRPIVRLYCWWVPVDLGARGKLVLLPDSMAIFMSFAAATFAVPLAMGSHLLSLGTLVAGSMIALLMLPVLLTVAVSVGPEQVRVWRLLGPFPYWLHRIPADAKFELYESFDDVEPTGVAFEAPEYGDEPLHLGTAATASSLYEHISRLLKNVGSG